MADETRSAAQSGRFGGWNSVQIDVDQIVATSPDSFDRNTIANVRDLLAVCRNESPVPMDVAKGDGNAVWFCWHKFEIEVFEDRLEIYHFYDQRSDIWYGEHRPGDSFTPRFLAELAALSAQ